MTGYWRAHLKLLAVLLIAWFAVSFGAGILLADNQSSAYRIVLLVEGSARVVSVFGEITLRPGTAAVISADDPDSFVQADGLVAVVQSTEVQVEPRRGIDPDEY